ncbi:MAG: right-handed parallel beta-helix repeat-containing protein [Halobacteriota archaeon]
MKKRLLIIPIVMIAVLALAAFSTSVSAQGDPGAGCNATTKFYGNNITGGIYFEQQGWASYSPMTKTFTNVPSGIKIARVYTGFWQGSPGKGGRFNITIQNNTGTHTSATYQACDSCPSEPCEAYQNETCRCDALNWSTNGESNTDTDVCRDYITGCGVQFVSFNATPYIASGSNTVTVKTSCSGNCTCWDGRIYVIALLVVYENSSMPNMTYWINEGAPYIEEGSNCDGSDDHYNTSLYFNGSHISNAAKVKYWTLGWPDVINATGSPAYTKLNGSNIGYPNQTESYGGGYNEVMLRWNNISTSYLDDTSNLLEYHDDDPFYERVHAAVLMIQGAVTRPDLTVSDIKFPTMMRPDTNYTINATVTNGGNTSGAFNVSLYVDDVLNGTVNVTGGLGAGNSITVSFENISLSESCYTFKVVADSGGIITESNENNNATSESYQVGYVVVVKSNSDFEKLNTSGSAALPSGCFKNESGTYYIQNLTIENCAGWGIQIENTNANFVIRNCTIQNCSEDGVLFRNLANGKINDSEVKDNSQKGIRLMNCSHVDMDNNTVQNNSKYGIDVYLNQMPNVDCEYINITNNTLKGNLYGIELIGNNSIVRDNNITNNTAVGDEGYGIYVFGNDSEIYNNTIKYNDNYGIYLDNTTTHPCSNTNIYNNTFIDNNAKFSAHTSQAYDNGNSNYWNTTTIGNYWTDWDDNSGAPGNYSIDGGTNKDYEPRGLYVFSVGAGADKWAYKYQVYNARPPSTNNVPNIVFTTTQYANIRADDQVFEHNQTTDNNYYAAHRFNFSINVSKVGEDFEMLNVTWNGKGWHDSTPGSTYNGTYLYIWNGTAGAGYEELDSNLGVGTEATLTGGNTSSTSVYIDSGNVTVLAEQRSYQTSDEENTYCSNIATDFIKLVITPF